ncbi:MAG: hypothetical protein RL708_1019 [Bacteroidota bacterium]|jgi:hypothetical protein
MSNPLNNSSKEEMVKHLKKLVVPHLRQIDFTGSFPHFRRLTSDRVNFLTFQFDRHGGGFVIEIANAKNETFKRYGGIEIEPNKLNAHALTKRKRIQANMKDESTTDSWFRYDKKYLLGFGNIYLKVCKDVLSKLDIANSYWADGEVN